MNISLLVNEEPDGDSARHGARSERPSLATRSSSGVYSATPPIAQHSFQTPTSPLYPQRPSSIDTGPHVFRQPSYSHPTPVLTPSLTPSTLGHSHGVPQSPFPLHDQSPHPLRSAYPQDIHPPPPLKRRATSEADKEVKRTRREPPAWARLHPSNPAFEEQIRKYPQLRDQPFPNQKPRSTPTGQTNSADQHANANHVTQQNGHAEDKKATVSRILNMPWELSITDTAPADKLLHGVAEFLYRTMLTRPQLGAGDPRNGSLEVEAKIGTLVDRDVDGRVRLPVETPCILNQAYSRDRVKFESFMDEAQHKALNEKINELIQASMAPLRVPMQYRHRHEKDSFATLSPEGIAALPPAAHDELERLKNDPRHKGVSIRNTVDVDPKKKYTHPPLIAQIVKLRLADLDIFCPHDPFDIRLSVNIEIDFHGRTGVDPAGLALRPDEEPKGKKDKDKRADRFKDRLSYKHLAYSIDLTQVYYSETRDGPKTHELEVEVDAAMLRDQAERLRLGQENAFEALVEGFLNNVFWLSRFRG